MSVSPELTKETQVSLAGMKSPIYSVLGEFKEASIGKNGFMADYGDGTGGLFRGTVKPRIPRGNLAPDSQGKELLGETWLQTVRGLGLLWETWPETVRARASR